MLQWKADKKTFIFTFVDNGSQIPLATIDQEKPSETFAQWVVLSELLDNGQAELEVESVCVPFEEIVRLSEYDQSLLKLPPLYPFEIVIKSQGMIHEADFKFAWGFYEYELGKQLFGHRIGCVVRFEDGSEYLLSNKQFELCCALDAFTHLPRDHKNKHENWIRFAEIKNHARDAAAILDKYLISETVIVPSIIHLRVNEPDADTLELQPEIDGVENLQYANKIRRYPSVQNIYNLEDAEGNRTRVVHTEKQKEALQAIKTHRRVTGKTKDEIINNPQCIFDPDVVDLDDFSQRVKEFGIYKSRIYPFIMPYKTQWIPGFCIDGQRVAIKNREELEKFKQVVNHANENDQTHIKWKDFNIPLTSADTIISTAERQINRPDKPIFDPNEKKSGETECIIIYENIEDLEYTEHERDEIKGEITLSPISDLKKNVTLLDHQEEGIAWMQTLDDKIPGVLLADDMGLGKTLQVLAYMNWVQSERNPTHEPMLIVAPLSLIENWEREYHTFFDHFAEWTVVRSDYFRIFNTQIRKNDRESPFKANHIYITNYDLLRRHGHLFGRCDWRVVVLDEAQNIKEPGILVTNTAKALKAGFRVAITGTPVENTLMNMWCIMDYAYPGLLGSAKDFAKDFQNPLKDKDTDVKDLGEKLRNRIGKCLRRKTKQETLPDLPHKYEKRNEMTMPDEQKQRYLIELQRTRKVANEKEDRRGLMLSVLHNLRDISDHPYITDRRIDAYSTADLIATSAKLKATVQILESIRETGEKVLLYAERKETQKLLVLVIKERFGIRAPIVNGDTPAVSRRGRAHETRQTIIDDFQQRPGFQALVLSPLTAGVGFNITGANHVIHYSRHWNPAKEQQATDRVYRIGQPKDVYVYYPMGRYTRV